MIQNLFKVADTTKEPNLLKHRDVKNAILAQAGRSSKEGEVQVIILIIWLYVVCDLLLNRHLQVPTFSEFVDYVVKETTGLESPKDWKVTNCWYKTRRCQRNSIRLPLFQLPALVVENWYMVVKRGLRSWDFFLVYSLNHLPKYQNPFLGYLFFIMSLQQKKLTSCLYREVLLTEVLVLIKKWLACLYIWFFLMKNECSLTEVRQFW